MKVRTIETGMTTTAAAKELIIVLTFSGPMAKEPNEEELSKNKISAN